MLTILEHIRNLFVQQTIPLKVFLIGLEEAGKTTFVKRLRLDKFVTTQRTMGLNVERIKVKGLNLVIWDLGGQLSFRRTLWPQFLDTGADLLIYVVDASDRSKIEGNRIEFSKVIHNARIAKVPILVLANKQDLPDCISAGMLARELNLVKNNQVGRSFHIVACSMLTGEGIADILDWVEEFSLIRKKVQSNL